VATKQYFDKYGVDGVVIRFGRVYGAPGKGSNILVVSGSATSTEELIVKPALGKPGKVPYGDAVVNWLYVEDAARAVVLASRTGITKTRSFNVNGDIRTMAEAVDCVRKLVPDAKFTMLPGSAETVGRTVKWDTTRAKEEIGFEPQWTLEQGIQKVIEEVRQQHNFI
jgi:nucleoside-diphosphate-sugar epimerase